MKRLETRLDRTDPLGGEEGDPAHVKSPIPRVDPTPKFKARKGPTGAKPLGRRQKPEVFREETSMIDLMKFIIDNYNKPDKFRGHPQSEEILEAVNHMLAVSMGGWHEEDDVYINESGRCASPDNWEMIDGRLVHRTRGSIFEDKDWIHDIRSAVLEGK